MNPRTPTIKLVSQQFLVSSSTQAAADNVFGATVIGREFVNFGIQQNFRIQIRSWPSTA